MTAIGTASAKQAPRRGIAAVSAAALLALLAFCLGGCGGSHENGTSADPATVVPSSAPVFAGAEVRPRGKLKDAANSAGQQLTHRANPYAGLLGALRTPGSRALDYSHDVAPWLGRHAGVFVTSVGGAEALAGLLLSGAGRVASFPFAGGHAQGAIVLDTSEVSAAKSFLESQAAKAGARQTSYRGVAYRVSTGGVAFALVKRFAVIGSEAAVRQVIDTAAGGASLAGSDSYDKLRRNAPSQALAHLYVAGGQGSAQAGAGGTSKAGAAGALLGVLTPAATASFASVVPASGSVAVYLDALAPAGPGGLLESAPEGAQAFAELPGESWLALGIGNAKGTITSDVRSLGSLLGLGGGEGEGAGGLSSLLGALLKPLQALAAPTPQARTDFASWMGPVGVFASGANPLELKGAVVIASTDASRSSAAVGKLSRVLREQGASVQPLTLVGTEAAAEVREPGLPLPLVIAAGHDTAGNPKFVLGLGQGSVTLALSPPSTLGGGARADAAAAALGEGIKPSLILSVPNLLALLEALSLTETEPIAGALPYLRAATTLSGGGRSLPSGIERVKLVLGLTGSGG